MNREAMLEKLHNISVRACPVVYTMDMGLQYDYVTSKGCGTALGMIATWPVHEFSDISEDRLVQLQNLVKVGKLTIDDLVGTPLRNFYNYICDTRIPNVDAAKICELFGNIKNASLDNGYIYVICDPCDYELNIQFFGSRKEMEKVFEEQYAWPEFHPWEEFDDEDLAYFIDKLEDELACLEVNVWENEE